MPNLPGTARAPGALSVPAPLFTWASLFPSSVTPVNYRSEQCDGSGWVWLCRERGGQQFSGIQLSPHACISSPRSGGKQQLWQAGEQHRPLPTPTHTGKKTACSQFLLTSAGFQQCRAASEARSRVSRAGATLQIGGGHWLNISLTLFQRRELQSAWSACQLSLLRDEVHL